MPTFENDGGDRKGRIEFVEILRDVTRRDRCVEEVVKEEGNVRRGRKGWCTDCYTREGVSSRVEKTRNRGGNRDVAYLVSFLLEVPIPTLSIRHLRE